MFSLDAYLVEFIRANGISIAIVLGFLKILAVRSSNTLDDSLIGYLGQALSMFRNRPDDGNEDRPPPPDDSNEDRPESPRT